MFSCCLAYKHRTRPSTWSVHGPYTAVEVVYGPCTPAHGPCTQPYTRPVHGRVHGLYTAMHTPSSSHVHGRVQVFTASVHGPYTAVYGPCIRPCTRAVYIQGRVHGPCTYTAVYMAMHTCTRPVHGHVWSCTRPSLRPVHGLVTGVHGT